MDAGIGTISFFLLVASTLMIAAAGNIINDYFDIRADRINKPEKLIIGKHIKRRVAIVTHWIINFLAFSIAIFLSIKLETFWYLFIHLMTINLLWYYSMYFKRKFFIGNIMIALMTALVPMLVGFYYHHSINLITDFSYETTAVPFEVISKEHFLFIISIGLGAFAFILNLAREITKDIVDVEGDKLIHAKTIPIVSGIHKAKWLAVIILIFALVGIFSVLKIFVNEGTMSFLTLLLVAVITLIAIIFLITGKDSKSFSRVNHIIKFSMVIGLLTPVYWYFLLFK